MDPQEIKQFDSATNQNVSAWLNGPYDLQTKNAIEKMLKEDPQEILDAFYTNLSFGTGGMRGLMGIGTNRVNRYTLRACSQGLANYVNKQPKIFDQHRIFIGYDTRHQSREFAEECAKVLAENDIKVYLFNEIRPTPLVSFGCRYKKCSAAIMLTASHNPPQYHGFKIFWNDGSQVMHPHDQGIINEVRKITDIHQVKSAGDIQHPLIEWVSDEIDQAYLKATSSLQLSPQINSKQGGKLNIVYTSLHGTGITLVPSILNNWGFSNIKLVDRQVLPDGDFPTCPSPNPEEKEALILGTETLLQVNGDLLIATDPDADRVGVVIRHQGKAILIDGNQMACLLLNHVLNNLSVQNRLPKNAAFVKTIVTTDLFEKICQAYNKPCFNVLTGFKYFGEKIRDWENSSLHTYIFGGEDSYGYLYGTLVRDKDAVLCSALICEMALQAKLQNKTLLDCLHEIWHLHGTYIERLLAIQFEDTKSGRDQITKIIDALKKQPPANIGGIDVEVFDNYFTLTRTNFKTGKTEKIELPTSNVFVFHLSDKSKLVIRPSGTEPKIKIYCSAVKKMKNIEEAIEAGEKHVEFLIDSLKKSLH